MRRIILMMSCRSTASPKDRTREIDWHPVDDELHSHVNEQLGAMAPW